MNNNTHIPTTKILENTVTTKVHVTLKALNEDKNSFEFIPASNQDRHEIVCTENLSFPYQQLAKQKLNVLKNGMKELLSTWEKGLETREKRLDGIRSSYRMIRGENCGSDSVTCNQSSDKMIDLQNEFNVWLGKIKMKKATMERT